MKNWWIALLVVPALAVPAAAQNGPGEARAPSPPAPAPASALSAGTGVVAELSGSLNAKNAKPGKVVKATVVQDVLSHGQVVIRAGSKLVGHLTQVKSSSKDDPKSQLGIAIEKVKLKGGGELPLDAAIRAMGPPSKTTSLAGQPDQMLPPGLMIGSSGAGNGNLQPIGTTSRRGGRSNDSGSTSSTPASSTPTNRSNAEVPTLVGGTSSKGKDNGRLLSAQSRGVFGLPGLKLYPDGSKGCVVASAAGNVKLEIGSQLVLEVNGAPGK